MTWRNPVWAWLDRRMYRELADGDHRRAIQCERNSQRHGQPYDFWQNEAARYTARALDYEAKATAAHVP